MRVSQAEFLTPSLRDLTISVLPAKMAGDAWGDWSDVKTGENPHCPYCVG